MNTSEHEPSAQEVHPLPTDLYSELHAVFTESDEAGLCKLIETHGAQALVDVRDSTYDDVILRHITDSHEFYSEDVVELAKILLDALETDEARYDALVTVGYENSPIFSAVFRCEDVLVELFLDSIPQDKLCKVFSLIETIDDYVDFGDLTLSFTDLIRFVRGVRMWKLCVHTAERVNDATAHHILMQACITQTGWVYRGSRELEKEYMHGMIDVLFTSIERIYIRDPSLVDAMLTDSTFSCKTPYRTPAIWSDSGTPLHYAVCTRCAYIVRAILQLCECRYAGVLLTTVNNQGYTPIHLADRLATPEIIDILSEYTAIKPALCRA